MKYNLDHLPEHSREEILQLTDIIHEVIQPDKIILFGSYAKGEQVNDRYFENGILYEYRSDYDILVVTKSKQEKEFLLTDKVVNRGRSITEVPINIIIHEMEYVNEGLRVGQYFFSDIIKEGVLLYDNSGRPFDTVKQLSEEELREIGRNYFNIWFSRGSDFLKLARECSYQSILKIGAFQLHQAAECFYNTLLLVKTGYKPKTHNLEKLRQSAKPYSKELMMIFPDNSQDQMDEHLFDLLKRGYIDARYREDYHISGEELSALIERVERMREVVMGVRGLLEGC